jgi:hypothetical protein
MALTFGRALRWSPRILGILVAVFIGLFALDAFGEGKSLGQELTDFVVHLIPACVILAVVAASFRWEWIGGVSFIGLAVWYAVALANGRLDWILVISGPLAVVGSLFLWSWLHRRAVHA